MWLSDFRVVLPDRVLERGSVRVDGERIAEISETPVQGGVPGDGLVLMPGFIDMHGDMIEREVEPRPNVQMPMELALHDLDRRLAGAGITTAYAALSFVSGGSNPQKQLRTFEHTSAVIRALQAARPDLRVDHRVHARVEVSFEQALPVVEALLAESAVDLVSLMDHTPGQGQYRDIERLIETTARTEGLSTHEAERRVSARIVQRTRPAEVLQTTLRRVADACAAHGVPLASHDDDTATKVAMVRDLGVTLSEFPVTEEAARTAKALGLPIAMGAPNALRGVSYSGNLSAREAHASGLLDMLASDYHPSAILSAVLVLAKSDPKGLPGAAQLAAQNPAQALGLTDRGAIRPGLRADLAVADESGVGRIRAAFRTGAMIYSDGTLGKT